MINCNYLSDFQNTIKQGEAGKSFKMNQAIGHVFLKNQFLPNKVVEINYLGSAYTNPIQGTEIFERELKSCAGFSRKFE